MTLTEHSLNRLLDTFALWGVDPEVFQPIYDYLVHGWEPGSFYTAVLANDFAGAVSRSHPSNQISELKKLSGWMQAHMPAGTWGSYAAVGQWLRASTARRRAVLEQANLIYDTKNEMWLVLKDQPTQNPYKSKIAA